MKKAPKGTTRGVFVVDKAGKVLAAEAGSPDGTVAVVKRIVESGATAPAADKAGDAEGEEIAQTASEVADTAAKLDEKA